MLFCVLKEWSLWLFPAEGHKMLRLYLEAATCQVGALSILIVSSCPMIVWIQTLSQLVAFVMLRITISVSLTHHRRLVGPWLKAIDKVSRLLVASQKLPLKLK